MKISVEIRWLKPVKSLRGPFSEGECLFVGVDCDYIDDRDDLMQAIEDDIGDSYVEGEDYELVNEEQFWKDMDCSASEITNPEALDGRLEKIREVLRRYFEFNDSAERNEQYDENYSAQAAIDDIHEIVGSI